MIYAQFYQLSTGYIPGTIPPQFGDKKPIEASGDRSVIVLDGRYNMIDNAAIASAECIKRGYVGYSIHKGETFTRSACVKTFQGV